MNFLISFLLLLSAPTFAQPGNNLLKDAAQQAVDTIKKLNVPLLDLPDCSTNLMSAMPIKCAKVTDNFCTELWNDKNEGNLKIFDGLIRTGKSKKSTLRLSVLDNDNALIKSLENMPQDMQNFFSPLLKKLSDHLDKEADNTKWYRDYSQIKQNISNAIEDLADERFDRNNSPATAKNYLDWTIEQSLNYQKELRNIKTQLTIAKYAKDPNWKRVEKLFPQVREDLLKTVDSLPITLEYKNKLKARLASVKLSLPIKDPNTIDASDECSETEVNAFYTSYTNHFTVCAGFFNSYQSESALITTISHELAHSIDSENMARHDCRSHSKISQTLNKLNGNSMQTYQCSEWKKINNETLLPKKEFKIITTPMDKLYSCLRGEKELDDMSTESINVASKQIIKKLIGNYADSKMFSRLIEKQKKINKTIKDSQTYYRPDLLNAVDDGYFEENQTRDTAPQEIFMQNFYCLLEENSLSKETYETASKQVREDLFDKAIGQTSKILENRQNDYLQYCGKNCAGLSEYSLSINPQEKIADWFANLSFPLFLKTLKPEDRVQATAVASSLFCPEGVESTEFTKAEKKYSLESHPDNRNRRISSFTPEVAKILNCELDESDLGDAKCNP